MLAAHMQILGINMAVGINGSIGKPMIREGREIHVYVRRSLRDIFRKVPTFDLEVKVVFVMWNLLIFCLVVLFPVSMDLTWELSD